MIFRSNMSDMLKQEIESPHVDIERSDFNNTLTAIRFLQASRGIEFNTRIFAHVGLYCDDFSPYIGNEKLQVIMLHNTDYAKIKVPEDFEETAKNTAAFIESSPVVSYCKVYYSADKDTTLVIVKTSSRSILDNKIASVLVKLLPYMKITRLKECEKSFFTHMANNELDGCVSEINKLAETMDLKSYIYDKMFVGVATGYKTRRVREAKNLYDESCRAVTIRYDNLTNAIKNKEDHRKNYEAMLLLEAGDDNEVRDFFKSYKNLEVEKVEGESIYFTIKDTIMYYDEDYFETQLENEDSYLYYNEDDECEYDDDIRTLLVDIFINHKYEIQTAAHFCLSGFTSLNPQSGYLPSTIRGNVLPHPHLYEYSCLGDNSEPIGKALMEGDWKTAVDQAIAATRNIWFGDFTVMSTFMRRFTENYYQTPFLKNTETGEMCSPQEAIEAMYDNK